MATYFQNSILRPLKISSKSRVKAPPTSFPAQFLAMLSCSPGPKSSFCKLSHPNWEYSELLPPFNKHAASQFSLPSRPSSPTSHPITKITSYPSMQDEELAQLELGKFYQKPSADPNLFRAAIPTIRVPISILSHQFFPPSGSPPRQHQLSLSVPLAQIYLTSRC